MGYRSEVLIKVPQHRWEQFKDLVLSKCDYAINLDEDDITFHEADRYCVDEVHMHYDYVKWYPGFEDVNAVMSSLDEMHEKYGMSYSYIRSGEETGDIEDMHEDGEKEDKGKDVNYCYASVSLE